MAALTLLLGSSAFAATLRYTFELEGRVIRDEVGTGFADGDTFRLVLDVGDTALHSHPPVEVFLITQARVASPQFAFAWMPRFGWLELSTTPDGFGFAATFEPGIAVAGEVGGQQGALLSPPFFPAVSPFSLLFAGEAGLFGDPGLPTAFNLERLTFFVPDPRFLVSPLADGVAPPLSPDEPLPGLELQGVRLLSASVTVVPETTTAQLVPVAMLALLAALRHRSHRRAPHGNAAAAGGDQRAE